MTVQITVLGLHQVGTSIGLALAVHKEKITRVGNDREPEVSRVAAKLGAFDQLPYNLPSAVEKAEVVVLALPVDEIRSTLEVIGPALKPGAVVVDTSPLQVQVLEWARELIPADRYMVSLTPTIAAAYLEVSSADRAEDARADLFKGALMIVTSPPGTDPDALKLAADLASLLGAAPFFADPYEADGLLAAVHLAPRLAAAALVNATAGAPGWNEARKLAGRAYAAATSPLDELDERKTLGQAALLNHDSVVRVLGNLIEELDVLRQAVAEGDGELLNQRLSQARQQHETWLNQRLSGNFDQPPQNPLPTAGEVIGRLVGLGKKRDKK